MYSKLINYRMDKNRIYFQYEGDQEGKEPCIEVISDAIINVFIDYTGMGHCSRAIEGELGKRLNAGIGAEDIKPESVSLEASGVVIKTKLMTVIVGDGFQVDFYDRFGDPLSLAYRGERKKSGEISLPALELLKKEGHAVSKVSVDYRIQELRSLDEDDYIYGLGDKAGGLNKRCYAYEMWNSDIPDPHEDCFKSLYKSIPFMLVSKYEGAYGIFFDNHNKTCFDLGKESEEYYWFGAEEGNLDYYFIAGDNLKEVITGYTYLTGRPPMQQLWTLGFHQSRWGYGSEKEIRGIAEEMRKNQLPCDCIHFDIDYMDHFKVFTWNQETYEDARKVISDFKDMGIKTVTIIDPGVKVEKGYNVYEEGMEQGCFARTPEGEVYVNEVWPGDAVYPDFGDPKVRRWWGKNHQFLVDMGVDGVWNDMNEPASFRGPLPDDVVFTDEDQESSHKHMHNLYGHNMAKAAYEGWKELTGKRPFVITRACYSGSQKYAVGWTGDNHSIWSHLRMAIPQMCNMGMSGMGFIGTDVGGFGSDCTPELFARWMQIGCFSPLFRNHCAQGQRMQEPWQFGEKVLAISRKYIRLRYALLPYIYDLMRESELTGIPMLRPLVLEYEKDEDVKNRNDEFMLGDRMLIAPVVEQGAREKLVYLPEGIWYDYWTGEEILGENFIIREAPLDVCPIYVKAGAVIPKYPIRMNVDEEKDDLLVLEMYPGKGCWRHYQDNGTDFAYRDGAYNEYEIKNDSGELNVQILHQGYKLYGGYELRLREKDEPMKFV